ncbi:hypothetical protein D3C78_908490 [compost metagenome]
MDGLRHQLLADAGFAADQHAEVAAGDQLDFLQQAAMGRALADQFARGRPTGFRWRAGFGRRRQPLAGFHRGRGQAGEGFQLLQLDPAEAGGVERVEGQQAPRPAVDAQRAAEAVVYQQLAGMALDQAVIGIGQRAVGGEAGRPAPGQQGSETRMLGDLEASPQGVGTQAAYRQRHQPVVVQAQQGHGVARQEGLQGAEQAPVAFRLGQLAGKVIQQRQQYRPQGVASHFDPSWSLRPCLALVKRTSQFTGP